MAPAAAKIDKKQAILSATLELLASCGFHGFSIKQLAARAGVATGTVYLYFKDREALISELHAAIILAFAEAAFEGHDLEQSLKQQYQRICSNIWHFCINHPDVTLSKAQFDHLPPEILRSQRSDAWSLFQPLMDLFELGRSTQQIKNLPNDVLASLSFEPYMFLARQHLLGVIEVDTKELSNIMEASWDAISR
ncbi:TetR/AcrR family transcriptional regulator [Methylophaga sp. OBS4]|uniref:TetR/AcrR family transcriptional regulator n=1 Tax=Methylophaga sp. OBS4 TaxID=2991935 RepID=UPI00225265DC|nr:TetR/AcrR family transcriptional regulator [Methylophaga sp. OBS4]MCX4188001.1 TetR/AcrR family transcriptional regulator [Methylophaga sp. OBS4]